MRRTGLAVLIVLLTLVGVGAADDGLVAEWHFDEGSGSVLYDSSGTGNDGTIHGATWVDGKVGGALSCWINEFDARSERERILVDGKVKSFIATREFIRRRAI